MRAKALAPERHRFCNKFQCGCATHRALSAAALAVIHEASGVAAEERPVVHSKVRPTGRSADQPTQEAWDLPRGRSLKAKPELLMIEIRFHGRGGQGAVVASEILADALFQEGKSVQAFPAFGVERRGAPVAAFLRCNDHPIRLRCQIEHPDHVVVLDPTLLRAVDVTAGLKAGGWLVINSERNPDSFGEFETGGWRVATVDASRLALDHELGGRTTPIVNTAILGAFARVTGVVKLESVVNAIRRGVPLKPENNVEAAREAYHAVRLPAALVGG